jgi:hypothetical protein
MAVQTNILPNGTSAPGTAFAGPVVSGDLAVGNTATNQGLSVCMQQVTLVANAANAVSATTYLPKHSVLIDIITDTTTAWNSATSDTLSVGLTAGGTEYASGVDTKTAAIRIRPTFTAAQLAAMLDASGAIVATVTPVGSAAAGQTTVTYVYAQTANWQNP